MFCTYQGRQTFAADVWFCAMGVVIFWFGVAMAYASDEGLSRSL
ncbi:putative membrane protein [Burkholderia cepacia]|nr:putative membrane protein [Burkholderia cepacia]